MNTVTNYLMNTFNDCLGESQSSLKEYARNTLQVAGYAVLDEDGYLYAEGDYCKVLLVAHLDTVYRHREEFTPTELHRHSLKEALQFEGPYGELHEEQHHFKEDDIFLRTLHGIGGDDRCGVAIALHLAETLPFKPSILLCEDEEIGCIGAMKFIENFNGVADWKFIVGLDRGGYNNVVFYGCKNREFQDFILRETGYEHQQGSVSDVSIIAPHFNIAACNLSVGYYNEHMGGQEFILPRQVKESAEVVRRLCMHTSTTHHPYVRVRIGKDSSLEGAVIMKEDGMPPYPLSAVQHGDNVVIGDRTRIGAGTTIGDDVIIGDDVTIGRGVTLYHGAVIEDGVTIEDFACLRINARVDDGARIGRSADIGEEAHIQAMVTVEMNATVGGGTSVQYGAVIESEAYVGHGCDIDPEVTVGYKARVGDGAVVRGDVKPYGRRGIHNRGRRSNSNRSSSMQELNITALVEYIRENFDTNFNPSWEDLPAIDRSAGDYGKTWEYPDGVFVTAYEHYGTPGYDLHIARSYRTLELYRIDEDDEQEILALASEDLEND